MSDATQELRQVLAEIAGEGRASAGPHVEADDLVAYREQRLGAGDDRRVQEHLAWCRECAGLLADLDGFVDPLAELAEPASELELAAGWRDFRRRLEQEEAAARAEGPAPSTRRAPRWLQAVAASLLLVSGALLWRVADLQRSLTALGEPRLNAPVVDLYTAGSLRGPEREPVVEVPAAAGVFTLILNSPAPAAHAAYRVTIERREGGAVWSGEGLAPNAFGSFSLTLSRRTIPEGGYRVRLEGRGASGWEEIAEYGLRVDYR